MVRGLEKALNKKKHGASNWNKVRYFLFLIDKTFDMKNMAARIKKVGKKERLLSRDVHIQIFFVLLILSSGRKNRNKARVNLNKATKRRTVY